MSSDALVQKIVQNKYGDLPKCDAFSLGFCNATFIKGEFYAAAQIDPKPGGPTDIQGASIYAGALADDDNPMFCEGLVGPPMDNKKVMNLTLPISVATSSTAISMKAGQAVLVVVVVTFGTTEEDMNQCVMTQVFSV